MPRWFIPAYFKKTQASKLGDAQGIPFFIDNIIRSLLVKLYFYSITSYVPYLERRFAIICCLRIFVLITLRTILNAIICCLQLNTGRGSDDNLKVDYLGIDACWIAVYVLCRNALIKSHSNHR